MGVMFLRWGSAAGLVLFINAAACDSVIIRDPAPGDDTPEGGSYVGPPSSGGATGTGGASSTGGAPTIGGESSIAGGPHAGGGPGTGGGSCIADPTLPNGTPVTIGAGLNGPVGLVLVGDDVYVTQIGDGGSDGALIRLPKLGGPLELVATEQNHPWAITADAEYVYWVNHGEGENGSLNRLAPANDSVEVLAAALRYPWGIAVHEGSLFATELNKNRVIAVRLNLSLEIISSAFTGLPIAVDANGVYVGVLGLSTWEESISRIDNQGNPSVVYDQQGPSEILLLDEDHLYFTDQGAIRRGRRDGAGAVTLANVSKLGGISAVIADCFLYFAAQEDTYVGRVPVAGGELQVLSSHWFPVLGVAAGATGALATVTVAAVAAVGLPFALDDGADAPGEPPQAASIANSNPRFIRRMLSAASLRVCSS